MLILFQPLTPQCDRCGRHERTSSYRTLDTVVKSVIWLERIPLTEQPFRVGKAKITVRFLDRTHNIVSVIFEWTWIWNLNAKTIQNKVKWLVGCFCWENSMNSSVSEWISSTAIDSRGNGATCDALHQLSKIHFRLLDVRLSEATELMDRVRWANEAVSAV